MFKWSKEINKWATKKYGKASPLCLVRSMNMSEAISIFWLGYATDLLWRHNNVPVTDHQTQGSSNPQTASDFCHFYIACRTLTLRACCICTTLAGLGWRSYKVRVVGWLGEEVCVRRQIARLRLCRQLRGVRLLTQAECSLAIWHHRVSWTS